MNIVTVENISKNFGEFKAVDGISFAIPRGTVFGLLGPNGAGKTTTIRMIMNIIIPDSGSITLFENQHAGNSSDFIGYLPEERGMYRKMKVGDLLLFLTELKSMPKKEAKNEIDYWLERFEIQDWKKKQVEELSKGMQQKLQFIGTIIHKPQILILDEPFGGLDPINTNLIKDIMLELKQAGTTIIFSTHVMESAEKLCEYIFLINKGRKVLNGNLSKIKKQLGKQNVVIEYEGDSGFLKKSTQIKSFDNYGNSVEIHLTPSGNAQELLKEAMQSVTIRKFEIKEPSLHDIFIESVNQTNAGGNENE